MQHVLQARSDRLDFNGLMQESEHEFHMSDSEDLYKDDDYGTEPSTGGNVGGGGELEDIFDFRAKRSYHGASCKGMDWCFKLFEMNCLLISYLSLHFHIAKTND